MNIRYYDRSGDLRKGYFYKLEVPFDRELWLRMESESRGWIVCDSTSVYDGQAWIEVSVSAEEQYDCPVDPSHTTGYENYSVKWADLHGGDWVADFVRDSIGESFVVTSALGRQLLATDLRGLALTDVPIRYSQAGLQEIPQFHKLDFQGRNCVRPYIHHPPEPNVCPRCHLGPVVCPVCGDTHFFCPECQLDLVGFSTSPHDLPFTAEVIKEVDRIVEAHEWDGSDFFAELYITRRALRTLMELKAEPFVAKPVWANVERLTPEQLAALEAM